MLPFTASLIPTFRCPRYFARNRISLVTISIICLICFTFFITQLYSTYKALPVYEFSEVIHKKFKVTDNLPDQPIFFLETTGNCKLNSRQACSIESAAKHHPDRIIIVYMLCKNPESVFSDEALKPLQDNPNIIFHSLDLRSFFQDTLLEAWYNSMRWRSSKFVTNHLSDAIRFIMLLKHGGIYLDLDIIVLRPLASLSNSFGLQDDVLANGAVLIFDAFNPFLLACVVEYANTYDPYSWGYNGPELITRVCDKHCGWKQISQWVQSSCLNATLLPREYFYAIPWETPEKLFQVNHTHSTLARISESYAIHLWNKYSKKFKVILGSGSAMDILMKKNCPNIYAHNVHVGEM